MYSALIRNCNFPTSNCCRSSHRFVLVTKRTCQATNRRHRGSRCSVVPLEASGRGSGDSNSGSKPPGGGNSGLPSNAGDGPPSLPSSPRLGQVLAVAVAAYMLLALYQPWRLLSGLQRIDTSHSPVSIIIPVLNEAGSILQTLQLLRQLQPAADEIIVVDGGSTDGTLKLARSSGLADKVMSAGRGRAVQMNAGADAASGALLCFLHADTQPPTDLVSVMRQQLQDPHTVLAGFVPSIEVPRGRLWLLSFHNFISTYYAPLLFRPLSYLRGLRNLFGDQTMFCRSCDFKAVGGFDTRWVIMEDTDLCVRMHEAGPCTHSAGAAEQAPVSINRQAAGVASRTRRQQQQQRQELCEVLTQAGGSGMQQLGQQWQQWLRHRGRVKQVLNRCSVTSGRRLDAWGPWKATYIHAAIGISWYFRRDPVQLKELYTRLYTDAFR